MFQKISSVIVEIVRPRRSEPFFLFLCPGQNVSLQQKFQKAVAILAGQQSVIRPQFPEQ
jgi:hypothetical protein